MKIATRLRLHGGRSFRITFLKSLSIQVAKNKKQLQLLPHTLAWLGRDVSCHLALYEMMRNSPEVFERNEQFDHQPTTELKGPTSFLTGISLDGSAFTL
jgi:hypothetical protein